jgi:hypothetical protein
VHQADTLQITDIHRFLYALFLAIDANFRLKRKDVSTEEKDPGLGNGWAFYCEVKSYMAHVKKNWNQKQEVCFYRLDSMNDQLTIKCREAIV